MDTIAVRIYIHDRETNIEPLARVIPSALYGTAQTADEWMVYLKSQGYTLTSYVEDGAGAVTAQYLDPQHRLVGIDLVPNQARSYILDWNTGEVLAEYDENDELTATDEHAFGHPIDWPPYRPNL